MDDLIKEYGQLLSEWRKLDDKLTVIHNQEALLMADWFDLNQKLRSCEERIAAQGKQKEKTT